jgi:hypothetical protein
VKALSSNSSTEKKKNLEIFWAETAWCLQHSIW